MKRITLRCKKNIFCRSGNYIFFQRLILIFFIPLFTGFGICNGKIFPELADAKNIPEDTPQTVTSFTLASIFQSGMVLQRNRRVPIWGWGTPDKNISVKPSWTSHTYRTKADKDGKWMIKIGTPEAGGPYTLTIHADTTIVLTNVLIGEVWLASGQSNMGIPVQGIPNFPVLHSKELIANSKNDKIRLFTVANNISDHPVNHLGGRWKHAYPASVAHFSAVAYTFGKKLQAELKIPVGIIVSAWGGTSIKSWMDKKTLLRFGVDITKGGPKAHQYPTVLFNAKIFPLIPFSIRGVIWYQGAADRGEPELYSRLFPAMIKGWRSKWGEGSFPFYFVQLAPYDNGNSVNSAYIREVQLKTMQRVPNTGMAVTLDIGTKHRIHPPYKLKVGYRLAYWALAKTYKINRVNYSGPVFKSMKIEGRKAFLSFEHAQNGLSIEGADSLTHFIIAGPDKQFYPAKVKITYGNKLEAWSDRVSHPVAVRYGWKNWLVGHLFDAKSLPAPSFRTDNW